MLVWHRQIRKDLSLVLYDARFKERISFAPQVKVGSEDLKNVGNDAQRIPIVDVITHPRYKRSTNYNDVAILKLRTPVRMASTVRPICIQTKSLATMTMPSNVSFIVIGWGATSFADDGSIKLMKTPSLRCGEIKKCDNNFF